jgi:hypothetical protein
MVACFANFTANMMKILREDAFRQENGAKNDAAAGSGSDVSYAGTTGEAACFNFRGKKFDAERKAGLKLKWEGVLRKCRRAFPTLCEYARNEPRFDVRGEMFGVLPEHVERKLFVRDHAVHLTKAFQDEIVVLLTAKFVVDGYLKAVMNDTNSYVNCYPEDGPFMICAIIVAL